MFELILDCPRCQKRFSYGIENGQVPVSIKCPECGTSSPPREYSALVLCRECRSKLKVPLSIFYENGNVCPQCGTEIREDFLHTMNNGDDASEEVPVSRKRKRMLQDGEFFDKFRIVSLLGRGGMAEVYLAEHLLLKQMCALKLMQRTLDRDDDPVFIKRFVREAKLTHSLSHPNIVKVFDAGSDFKTGYLFLAMEYVEGSTLHELIYKKGFSEKELLDILFAMGGALKSLETAKIVHRDIKPSNIMYTREGVYKLMDLGIAKMESNHQAGDMTLTMEQSTMGTPGYASPEQCRAAHQTDIRSDIFSLGATLYHAATGNIPFTGDTPVATILNVMQSEAAPVRNFRDDLSDGFIALLEKMMKKKPSERFRNADELLEAAARIKEGKGHISPVRKLGKAVSSLSTTLFSPETEKKVDKAVRLFQQTCKIIFILLLTVVILVHAYYLSRTLNKSGDIQKISYTEFIKGICSFAGGDDVSLSPEEALEMRLQEMHPMIQDPDRELSSRQRLTQRGSVTEYPLVTLPLSEDSRKCEQYDFTVKPGSLLHVSDMLHNGMLELTGPHKTEIYLRNTQDAAGQQIVFLNFQLSSETETALFTFNDLDVFVRKGTLQLVYGSLYHADTSIRIPSGRWINLGVSLDWNERRINVFSGNLLLGSYFFPRESNRSAYVLRFRSETLGKSMQGKIDFLAVCSLPSGIRTAVPRRYGTFKTYAERLPDALPGKKFSSVPPLPAEAPAAVKGRDTRPVRRSTTSPKGGTAISESSSKTPHRLTVLRGWTGKHALDGERLEESLQRSKENFYRFSAAIRQWQKSFLQRPGLPREFLLKRKEICDAAQLIAEKWEKRIQYMTLRNQLIRERQRKNYDTSVNQQISREISQYTEKRHVRGFSSADAAFSRRLNALLASPGADPDLVIHDSTHDEYSGPVINAVVRGRFWQGETLLGTLIRRRVSPEHLEFSDFSNKIRNILIDYGVPGKLQDAAFDVFFEGERFPGDAVKLLTTLLTDGAVPSQKHLAQAVRMGSYEVVLFLLACGLDPESKDAGGRNAFSFIGDKKDTLLHRLLLATKEETP